VGYAQGANQRPRALDRRSARGLTRPATWAVTILDKSCGDSDYSGPRGLTDHRTLHNWILIELSVYIV
jgi:hypothetical protein